MMAPDTKIKCTPTLFLLKLVLTIFVFNIKIWKWYTILIILLFWNLHFYVIFIHAGVELDKIVSSFSIYLSRRLLCPVGQIYFAKTCLCCNVLLLFFTWHLLQNIPGILVIDIWMIFNKCYYLFLFGISVIFLLEIWLFLLRNIVELCYYHSCVNTKFLYLFILQDGMCAKYYITINMRMLCYWRNCVLILKSGITLKRCLVMTRSHERIMLHHFKFHPGCFKLELFSWLDLFLSTD